MVLVDDELRPLREPAGVVDGEAMEGEEPADPLDILVGRRLEVEPDGGAGIAVLGDLVPGRVDRGASCVHERDSRDRFHGAMVPRGRGGRGKGVRETS